MKKIEQNELYERYRKICKCYREELDEQVKNGEIDKDYANFMYFMNKEDIWYDLMLREEEDI